jgi:hypothetical protein
MTSLISPGIYVSPEKYWQNIPPPPVMDTVEDVAKAIEEACHSYVYAMNNDATYWHMKETMTSLLHMAYAHGHRFADRFGNPIENVEDVDVQVYIEGHNSFVNFLPTQDYVKRRMEKSLGTYERLIRAIFANPQMERFDPCI